MQQPNQALSQNRSRSTPDTIGAIARAAVAQTGNYLSHAMIDRTQQIDGWPQAFGAGFFVANAPVVSSRKIGTGATAQWERIQVISTGRIGTVDYGEVEAIANDFYNLNGTVIGQITAWRPGLINQAPLPQAGIWEPGEVGCCTCDPATGVVNVPIYAAASTAITLVIGILGDGAAHAWLISANGTPIGTVWQSAQATGDQVAIDIAIASTTTITLTPITTGGTAPIFRADPTLTQTTIAPFSGLIQSAPLPGSLVAVPASIAGIYSQGNATNYPGLCVAQTLSRCTHPPVFRVIRGKTCRQVVAAGVYYTQQPDVSVSYVEGPTPGDSFINLDSTVSGVITSIAPTLQTSPNVPLSWGDRWIIQRIGQSKTLPDVTIALIDQMAAPPNINYPAMADARLYCLDSNSGVPDLWRGMVEDVSLQKFMVINAPQAGLIPSRSRGAVGYATEIDETPIALFTVANCSDFEVIYHPYGEHRLDRLVIWDNPDDLHGITPRSISIERDNLPPGPLLEEAVSWPHCENLVDLGRLYARSITYQDRSIRFITNWASFAIEEGNLIQANSPDLEVGANFSGYCDGTDNAGNIIPSWQPVIASGVTAAGSGLGVLIDSDADFNQLCAIGDAVNVENQSFIITGVTQTTLTVTGGAVPVGGRYSVLDLTTTAVIDAWDSTLGLYQTNIAIVPVLVAGRVHYQVPAPPMVFSKGVVLTLREGTPNLWRVASINPISTPNRQSQNVERDAYEYLVTATRWSPKLYDYSGLKVVG